MDRLDHLYAVFLHLMQQTDPRDEALHDGGDASVEAPPKQVRAEGPLAGVRRPELIRTACTGFRRGFLSLTTFSHGDSHGTRLLSRQIQRSPVLPTPSVFASLSFPDLMRRNASSNAPSSLGFVYIVVHDTEPGWARYAVMAHK